jgi:hypothetical protein
VNRKSIRSGDSEESRKQLTIKERGLLPKAATLPRKLQIVNRKFNFVSRQLCDDILAHELLRPIEI